MLEEINLDDQKSDLLRSGGHEGILYDALDACLLAGMYSINRMKKIKKLIINYFFPQNDYWPMISSISRN